MITQAPTLLFAFANDEKHALQLGQEERAIRESLQHLHDNKNIEYHLLGMTTLDDIYKSFNRFHNRIHIFHLVDIRIIAFWKPKIQKHEWPY